MNKRYNTINEELKNKFSGKVMKLSLDGGFTCPNRDGTVGSRGCIFCGEEGSGEFAGDRKKSLKEQAEEQKILLSKKWKSNKYIAYFQNFTNTYDKVEKLKKLYYEALEIEGVVGLAIATRPDCLNQDVIELLEELNEKTYLWVELGLQTIHEHTAKIIRRGYPLSTYDKVMNMLNEKNIRVVTHIILGLPGESKDLILETVKYVSNIGTWGVKLHGLYIQRDTDLYDYYINHPFKMFSMEEYISVVADALEILGENIIVHRVTGDGKRDLLHQPKWSLNKLKVITGIDMELKKRDSYQGNSYL